MGCGISSNSPVVAKRLAGRTSRVEDCSPLEQQNTNLNLNRIHSSSSIKSLKNQELPSPSNIYSPNSNFIANGTELNDSPDPLVDQQNQYNSLMAKNQRGITAVQSKNLANSKSPIDQIEGQSDRQTGKESVETNNSRNDSNYGSSYSAETVSKTPIQITSEALQQFLEIEKQIKLLEKKHILDEYLIRTEQLEKLETSLEQIKANKYRCLEDLISNQNKMGYKDLQSVKEFITKKSYVNNTLNLEEELFLDTLNKKEILERDFENLNQQQDMLKQKIDQLANEGEKLQVLFTDRDQLLDQMFDGQYGSDLENQLEKELDWLLEQKHHVDQAYFRWKQAHLCVKQACKNLTEAIDNWKHYLDIPVDENETRYQIVAETRNLLLSGSQQLQNCQRYLNNIELPYCSQEEIEMLERAISFIFTDMQSQERHEHALSCYQTTLKRSNALKQWLEQVLNMIISRDLYLINEDCKSRTSELRNERIRLIKSRIKELNGSGTSTSTNYDLRDSGVDSELDDSTVDEQLAKLFENGRNQKDPKSLTPDPTRMPFAALLTNSQQLSNGGKENGVVNNFLPNGNLNNRSTPKFLNHTDSANNSQAKYKQALDKYDQNFADKFDNAPANSSTPSNGSLTNEQLAPIPSSEQIFGRINELKQRFKNEIDQIRRQQQFSQLRVAQGLREKLNERRHRRSRAAMNNREIEAINTEMVNMNPIQVLPSNA